MKKLYFNNQIARVLAGASTKTTGSSCPAASLQQTNKQPSCFLPTPSTHLADPAVTAAWFLVPVQLPFMIVINGEIIEKVLFF